MCNMKIWITRLDWHKEKWVSRNTWRWCYGTFGIISAMNFCPPNPGSTVMIRTMSTRVTNGRTDSTGVFGLTPTPTFIPAFFICSINALGLSAWKRRIMRWKLVSKIIISQYFHLTIRAYLWERRCKQICNLICTFYKDNYCKLKEN